MPSPTTFVFGPHVLGSTAGFDHEWLVSDGVGGYAMGTIGGLRTRRYHGLLVVPDAAVQAVSGVSGARNVGLVSLDPVLTLPSGAAVPLATHEWASRAIAPAGHHHLERFDLVDGLPRWRWRIGEVLLERELAMLHGSTALGVVHRLVAGPPVRLTLTALCTWRDAHGERDRHGPRPRVSGAAGGAVVERAYRLAGRGWKTGGEWFVGAFARREAERGLEAVEDLWAAGAFTVQLKRPGDVHEVSAWAGELDAPPPSPSSVVALARKRARRVVRAAGAREDVDAALALAADAFIISTGGPAPKKRKRPVPAPGGPTVVAGYPWFGSSLRDTMTSYEGLFLLTGRADEGRALLLGHAAAFEEPPAGDADGPLWFIHAVDRHVARTGDTALAAALLPTVTRIIEWYAKGTPDGIAPDPADGLLAIDADAAALTWMNVRINGRPVTPRNGKPVELNALWVNALGAAVALHEAAGGSSRADHAQLAGDHDAARASFAKRFAAAEGWLYDLVDAGPAPYPLGGGGLHDDPVLRPNQLLAFSLPHAPLAADRRVLHTVGEALLTPLGLRSLAPAEPGYHGVHRGGAHERDAAYHQGTVWPWLIGPFAAACRAAGLSLDGLLGGLEAQLGEFGLGSVSETADGDAPHRPTGSPFSARSVAELIRARSLAREAASQRP
jgi:predicted glycogen debranching enzyme